MELAVLPWRDTRRPLWPLALVVPVLPFASVLLAAVSGSPWSWWLTPLVVFGVIPLIDVLVGDDRANPPDEAVPALQASPYYRWITYLFLPAQFAALAADSIIRLTVSHIVRPAASPEASADALAEVFVRLLH